MKGYVCWEKENVRDIIDPLALNIEPAFLLATHTPFNTIDIPHDEETKVHQHSEESLLESIVEHFKKRNCFMVVEGVPGTGKSNLIWWFSYRLEQSLRDTKVILIKRSEASLARTLASLISLLGKDYEDLVSDFSRAVSNLTMAGQCFRLLDHLAESLDPRATRDMTSLPDELLRLKPWEFLHNAYVREVLCGENAIASRIIDKLVHRKGDTEGIIQFKPDDLKLIELDQIKKMSKSAQFLAIRLRKDTELRTRMADEFNKKLSSSIRNLIDLTPDKIYNAFDAIRERLARKRQNLAMLIEDVATFQGVDLELINYLSDPPKKAGLCRLISVVGITNDYYQTLTLRPNIIDRITHHARLEEGQGIGLFINQTALANFAGRYLNAVRIGVQELKKWHASLNYNQQEAVPNKCNDCTYQETCHDAFGSSEEGHGFYPFTPKALWNCLSSSKLLLKTPRYVLTKILKPVLLESANSIKEGSFPPSRLSIDLDPPILKTSSLIVDNFLDTRIPASNQGKRHQYKSLIYYYGDGTTEGSQDNMGHRLVGSISEKIFEIFDIPLKPYSKIDPPLTGPKVIQVEPIKPVKEDKETKEFKNKLKDLIEWSEEQSKLAYAEWYRTRIWNAFREFIDLEFCGLSEYEFERIIKEASIYLEDQITYAPAREKIINFERNSATRYALEALLRYEFVGKNSWNFENGIEHQRTLFYFLHQNEPKILSFLNGAYGSDHFSRGELLEMACESLMWSGQILGVFRPSMPFDETIKKIALYEFDNTDTPLYLGDAFRLLSDEARKNFPAIREVIFDTLEKKRGGGTIRFIDSTILQNTFSSHPTALLKPITETGISNLRAEEIWQQVPPFRKKLNELAKIVDEVGGNVGSACQEIEELLNGELPEEYSKNLKEIFDLARKLNILGPSCDGYRDASVKSFDSSTLKELGNETGRLNNLKTLAERFDFLLFDYPENLDNILQFMRAGNKMVKYLEGKCGKMSGKRNIGEEINKVTKRIQDMKKSIDELLNKCLEVVNDTGQK